jgi:hypothetical protein
VIAGIGLHADPGRTIIIAVKRIRVEMIRQGGGEGLMMFWHAELLGWIICWKQGIEKTMEIAFAYETDIANLNASIWVPWTWPPQGMSVRRVLDCKLFAEDVKVSHRGLQEYDGERRGDVARKTCECPAVRSRNWNGIEA